MTRGARKVGMIAGSGALPVAIAHDLQRAGTPMYIARISSLSDPALEAFEGASFGLGAIGALFSAFRSAGCDTVVYAGVVRRADPSTLDFDAEGLALLPKVLSAMREGDDALLRVFVEATEEAGFKVIGAEEAAGGLLVRAGAYGVHAPQGATVSDIARGAQVAAAIGAWDVGQGVVVCEGLVLAVEAQEGTDAMLMRVAGLPATLRGRGDVRRGVLVKRPKPAQERRIDLPTIGLQTIENAAAAGLIGIAVEAGAALFLQQNEAIARADALGLFVFGFVPEDRAR
jgi:UDP-2,3-diacylglucosamine hydrolase